MIAHALCNTYDILGTYICPVAIVGCPLYSDSSLYPGGALSFPYLNASSKSSSFSGAYSPRPRAIFLVCFSMNARLYWRSRSLLVLAASASGASFEGCSLVSVTPLTSDLDCLCHVRGFHQATAISLDFCKAVEVVFGSTHPSLYVISQVRINCSQTLVQGLRGNWSSE